VNGTVWSTESDAEMQEWLSRIDSTDIDSITVMSLPQAAALYGARGNRGGVMVVLKRGSASERRFRVPPAPWPALSYCHRPLIAPRDASAGTPAPAP
jgi:hypothetical protein